MVPRLKKQSCADTVIACHQHSNSRYQSAAMAQLLECQKWPLLNKFSDSDSAPSSLMLLLPKSSENQNIPQSKANGYQKVPQCGKATVKEAKRCLEVIVFRKTPGPTLSDDQYPMVEGAGELAIEAPDCQLAFADVPVDTLYLWQLPSLASLEMNPQTGEAVSPEIHLARHHLTNDIDYTSTYT